MSNQVGATIAKKYPSWKKIQEPETQQTAQRHEAKAIDLMIAVLKCQQVNECKSYQATARTESIQAIDQIIRLCQGRRGEQCYDNAKYWEGQ